MVNGEPRTDPIFPVGHCHISRWIWNSILVLLDRSPDTSGVTRVQEQRIKSHEQEKARLAALLQPKTAEAFSAIRRAPSHRMDVPYSPAQITARPEYRLLLDLGMITIEQIAPNQTSLSITSAATSMWEAVKRT
jgi:hypothetical protein